MAAMTPTLDEFAAEVQAFFDGVPALLDSVGGSQIDRARAYRAALFDAGLAGIGYPVEYGGRNLGIAHQDVFRQIAAPLQPPEESTFGIGIGMALPTILDYGSEALKARLLPSGLRGDEIWCQLYSEPGAGSDLAGLTCKAERDGDEWVITGQKVWTSGAQHSDLGILIARTDPDSPKHAGITMFVLPMHQPGVEVRPLVQMTGIAEFNEVFMDEARCPAEWVVGEVNHGWRLATALLAHERVSLGRGQMTRHAERSKAGRFPIPFEGLLERAGWAGRRHDPVIRQQLAQAYIGEQIIPWLTARRQHPSIGKLWRTIQGRLAADIAHELGGGAAIAWDRDDAEADYFAYHVLNCRGMSLGGGTDEVQKNTLGEHVLGLPREPGPDKNTPFRELLKN
ncbi:MAG: acyl-CoA dehydrogenase family protein [Acidimicrobiales bacterium]